MPEKARLGTNFDASVLGSRAIVFDSVTSSYDPNFKLYPNKENMRLGPGPAPPHPHLPIPIKWPK